MSPARLSAVLVALGALAPGAAGSPPTCFPSALTALPFTAEASAAFGYAVAVDGSVAVVGAPGADGPPPDVGVVSIYREDGSGSWNLEAGFPHPRGTVESFARQVDVSGNVVVSGSPTLGSPYGQAHVFRYDGSSWAFEDSLSAADSLGSSYPFFGSVVAVDGDRLAVRQAVTPSVGNGEIHLFRFDGTLWQPDTVLRKPDGDDRDEFASTFDLHGDVLVVGTPNFGAGPGTGKGAVHVYRHDGVSWVFEQRLDSPGARAGEEFGMHVAVDGSTIAVAAPNTHLTPALQSEGAVYVLEHDGAQWASVARLTASDAGPSDQLGLTGVSLAGDVILASALFGTADSTANGGAVYAFPKPGTGWADATESAKLIAPAPVDNNEFGRGVATNGTAVLVGEAGNDDDGLADAGKVFTATLGCGPDPTGAATSAAAPVPRARLLAAPNPFRERTALQVTLAVAGEVRLEMYDVRGRRVDTLVDGAMPAGRHLIEWAPPPSSGVHFAVLHAGGRRVSRTVVAIR